MKDMRAVRFNEKIKRLSILVGNGGLALLIAGATRWYALGLDLSAGVWILLAAAIIWVAMQLNELLDSEDQ